MATKIADPVKAAQKARDAAIEAAKTKSQVAAIKSETRQLVRDIEKPGFFTRIKNEGFFKAAYGTGKRNLKIAGIGVGVLAALGTAAYMLRGGQKDKTKADIAAADMLPPPVAMDPTVGAGTLMGEQPVAGQHAARIEAGRGIGGPALGA